MTPVWSNTQLKHTWSWNQPGFGCNSRQRQRLPLQNVQRAPSKLHTHPLNKSCAKTQQVLSVRDQAVKLFGFLLFFFFASLSSSLRSAWECSDPGREISAWARAHLVSSTGGIIILLYIYYKLSGDHLLRNSVPLPIICLHKTLFHSYSWNHRNTKL